MVPAFTGATEVDLPVACTLRLRGGGGASTSHALDDGEIPLLLLFSGTVFTRASAGFQRRAGAVGQRGRATGCRSAVWRELMDRYFPGSGWLRLRRDTLRRAAPLQGRPRPWPTWDEAVEAAARGGRRMSRRELRAGPEGRRRGALRGLPALPLPGLGGQEPGALAVRRARAARGRRRRRERARRSQTECLVEGPAEAAAAPCGCASSRCRRADGRARRGRRLAAGRRAEERRADRTSPGTRRSSARSRLDASRSLDLLDAERTSRCASRETTSTRS